MCKQIARKHSLLLQIILGLKHGIITLLFSIHEYNFQISRDTRTHLFVAFSLPSTTDAVDG